MRAVYEQIAQVACSNTTVPITGDTHAEAMTYIGRFMQYYRERAKYLEQSYDFVERIGIEKIHRAENSRP